MIFHKRNDLNDLYFYNNSKHRLIVMRIYKYGKIRKLQCVINVYESYFNRADPLYKVTADK